MSDNIHDKYLFDLLIFHYELEYQSQSMNLSVNSSKNLLFSLFIQVFRLILLNINSTFIFILTQNLISQAFINKHFQYFFVSPTFLAFYFKFAFQILSNCHSFKLMLCYYYNFSPFTNLSTAFAILIYSAKALKHYQNNQTSDDSYVSVSFLTLIENMFYTEINSNFIISSICKYHIFIILQVFQMTQLTVNQQYFRVIYLGVCFMIMFSSFNSLQNIVSKLYDQYNYVNLGQWSIIVIYLSFGICTIFSSFIIKKLGYKTVMFGSSLGYALFQSTGFLIVLQNSLPRGIGYIIVLIGSMVCGASAAVLWVAQAAYTSEVASADRKSQLFGLFWGIMMSSQIVGNLITSLVLGKISNIAYFIILSIMGFLSALLFLFLPNVSNKKNNDIEQYSLKEQISKIMKIISDKRYRFLMGYFMFPGLAVAFYAGFLYKIITVSVKINLKQENDDYQKRVNYLSGLVFICLGGSQLLTGIMMNRVGDKWCKFKSAIGGTLIVQIAVFVSFIAFFMQNYTLCFVCAFFWGCAENFLQTNTNALIAQIFPNSIEAYSVYRIFFALGCCATLFLSITISHLPQIYFLTLILVFQILATICSFNLVDLKNNQPLKQKKL